MALTRSTQKAKKSVPGQLTGAGTLTLTIIQADNLSAMDSNGKSDPFCVITNNLNGQTFQTHTIKKTLEPGWNEVFPIYIGESLEPTNSITVKVWDRDKLGKDFLGEVTLEAKLLLDVDSDELEQWYVLKDEPNPSETFNPEGKKPGRIRIKMHFLKSEDPRGVIKYENPTKFYSFRKKLGSGAFGEVKLAVNRKTHEQVAVKILKKKKMDTKEKTMLEREIRVMAKLHHSNIVQMIEVYDTPHHTYLIMELVGGGELFKEIIKRTEPFYEANAAQIVSQLLSGVGYMHSCGVAHRDLKPENILLTGDKKTIKITDFGLSKDFGAASLNTSCGTCLYVAPEVLLASSYDSKCDIWSVGVITYVILTANVPFHGENENEIFDKILNCNFSFPDNLWGHLSSESKDFINSVFVLDSKKRLTAEECLKHPWIIKFGSDGSISGAEMKAFSNSMAAFNAANSKKESESENEKGADSGDESDDLEESGSDD